MKRFLGFFIVILMLVACQQRPVFDDERALEHYQILRAYRTSFPGQHGNDVIRQYILNRLRKSAGLIEEIVQESEGEDGSERARSILCRFYPQMSRRILFVASYALPGEERIAERDDEIDRSVFNPAIMLEIAEMLSDRVPRQFGVDLIFLDIAPQSETVTGADPSFGALEGFTERIKPEHGFFLRLRGESDLKIPIDHQSYQELPHVVDRVWGRAQEAGWALFEKNIVVNRTLAGEDILYERFNSVRLENAGTDDVAEDLVVIKDNFRTLGVIFEELIYAGD